MTQIIIPDYFYFLSINNSIVVILRYIDKKRNTMILASISLFFQAAFVIQCALILRTGYKRGIK